MLPLVAATLLAAGCSARQRNDGVQQGRRNDCERLPPSQRAACLESTRVSYEQYERQRAAVRCAGGVAFDAARR